MEERYWKKKFKMNTDLLGVGLSQCFFPHEHYAQLAYNFAIMHLYGGTEAATPEGIPNHPQKATVEEKMEV